MTPTRISPRADARSDRALNLNQFLLDMLLRLLELLFKLVPFLFNALLESLPLALWRLMRWRTVLVIGHGATSPGFITHTLPCARSDFSQSHSRFPTCCCSNTSSIRAEIVSSFGGVTFCFAYSGNIVLS